MYRDVSLAEIFGGGSTNYINVKIQRIGFNGQVINPLKRAKYVTLDNLLGFTLLDLFGRSI